MPDGDDITGKVYVNKYYYEPTDLGDTGTTCPAVSISFTTDTGKSVTHTESSLPSYYEASYTKKSSDATGESIWTYIATVVSPSFQMPEETFSIWSCRTPTFSSDPLIKSATSAITGDTA